MQLEIMRGPSLEELTAKVESYKPTFVYVSGPYSGLVDSIKGTVGPITLQGGSDSNCHPYRSSRSVLMPVAVHGLALWLCRALQQVQWQLQVGVEAHQQ